MFQKYISIKCLLEPPCTYHLVDVEQLVQVQEEPGQVGDEEEADDTDQDHGQLELLGLLEIMPG